MTVKREKYEEEKSDKTENAILKWRKHVPGSKITYSNDPGQGPK